MKNTLQTVNYIKHRHSDNACSKARRVNLKVPILRQQK
jgi:hypothetical protein